MMIAKLFDTSNVLLIAATLITLPQLRIINQALRVQISRYVEPGLILILIASVSLFRSMFSSNDPFENFAVAVVFSVLYNFQGLLSELHQSRIQLASLERNNNQSKAAYMALLDDKNELATQIRRMKQEANSRRSQLGSDVAKQLLSTQSEVKRLQERCSAMEKHADITKNEVLRLQQEKKTLRSQLKSFEMVFGEQRKKLT
uniref:Uncharacterized protein n=1 Tax=Spongospora subterranea TaxID=70186 RepID=A0A0H5R8G0_9EUKA|eukprot:CRZ10418.1 hypothetical protein [Spongospora subterranea]